MRKDKNCKTFFKTGQCPYGVRCLYQHEHRHINQIKRYPHTVRLITYESLFANSVDQTKFLETHETGVPKLSMFAQIHAEGDKLAAAEKEQCISEAQGELSDSGESTTGSLGDFGLDLSQIYLSD